jgi:hypothetical protein
MVEGIEASMRSLLAGEPPIYPTEAAILAREGMVRDIR